MATLGEDRQRELTPDDLDEAAADLRRRLAEEHELLEELRGELARPSSAPARRGRAGGSITARAADLGRRPHRERRRALAHEERIAFTADLVFVGDAAVDGPRRPRALA